ncbi:CdaR family protein [Niallia sp. XMNu-256]|uniref:CdaR family protein n=1 Tax=Niallia sp. XMNu-256 TaxID=3082444 RepID=UPI0030CCE2D1
MDKWLDRLTDNRTFMKLVALVLAFLLFGSIYDENKGTNDVNVPGESDAAILDGIPVKSYYDTENLVVTGVPETVEITLEGPKPNVRAAKTQKDFEVFVDLTKAKVGKQRVMLQVKDLSPSITPTISPAYIEVNVQERETKEFSIEVEYNQKMIADGYKAGVPVIDPKKVTISGGKDVMEQIAYVKAIVPLSDGTNGTINKTAPITVLDKDLNKLNVVLGRESVKVTIPVEKISKTVPIEIVEKGSPPQGIVIDSITLDKKETVISGSKEALNRVENVRVEVDLSKINESTELTLPVIISDGIKEVEPQQVTATIVVSQEVQETTTPEEKEEEPEAEPEPETEPETKIFSGIPIEVEGIPDEFTATIQEPSNGKTSLTVVGSSAVFNNIKQTDFQVFVNVANLSPGDHEVELTVDGPEEVSWELSDESVSISISEKEASST